jgi:hypothetical protein
MVYTAEQEPLIRYLSGELDDEEQQEIEERYFRDPDYFEDLLRLEEDLVDVYTRQKSLRNPLKGRGELLGRIERIPEVEFAREWVPGILDAAEPLAGKSASRVDTSRLKPEDDWRSALAQVYEAKLQAAELEKKKQENEDLLLRAWENRELASALMEHEWLGLRVIMSLQPENSLGTSELATALGVPIDSLVHTLIRLVRFDALREEGGVFSLTEKGGIVIRNIENPAVNVNG